MERLILLKDLISRFALEYQDKIIEIDREYIQKFIKVSTYIKTRKKYNNYLIQLN